MKLNTLIKRDIEEKAITFRDNNGYGVAEPIILSSLLLKKNIITVFKPLPGDFAGMAIKAADDSLFIMINQEHTIGRQNFTIGHELYHLCVQENFASSFCNAGLFDSQSDVEERKADFFSACLLLPRSGIHQLIPVHEAQKKNNISIETIFKVQQYYGLSINAVIYRLIELDYVDKSYFDMLATGKMSLARKLGYDTVLYNPGNFNKIIGDYGTIVNNLYQSQKISESVYLEFMNDINVDPLAPIENDFE
jgi:Zn-dependent peptidase ImmA (M78 family)